LARGKNLDAERDDEDGHAEIADELVEKVEGEEHRLGQEIEPAPVNQKIELGNRVSLGISVDEVHFLGAGKHLALGFRGAAGLDGERGHQIVGLEAVAAVALASRQPCFERVALLGDDHRDAEPAFIALEGRRRLVDCLLVGDLLEPVVHDTDQALMQDVVALHLRCLVTRDERVRIERDGL